MLLGQKLAFDGDRASLGSELKSITLEVNEHLLEPEFISANHVSVPFLFEVDELCLYLYTKCVGLVLLDLDDFVDCVLQVKPGDVLAKFLLVDLG